MTAAGDASPSTDVSPMQLVGAAGDQSGRETFSKYRYQSKLTLSYWLQTLLPDGPIRIYSERIEDLVIEYSDRIRFCQVKTRDPGLSRWTVNAIVKDGGGLDSLLRCFRCVGNIENASFELFLEGEASDQRPTPDFFATPASGEAAVLKELTDSLGATLDELNSWLPKVRINPRQVSRAYIDDRNLVALWKMLQSVPYQQVNQTYRNLLASTEDLQSGEWSEDDGWWAKVNGDDRGTTDVPFLCAEQLRDLLPRTPVAPPEEWARLLSDPTLSDLERKLILAGADYDAINDAKELRAIALPRIRELQAGPQSTAESYERLTTNILRYAKGVARTHSDKSAPAPHVLGDITKSADSAMKVYDTDNLFSDPFSLAGVVCQVSDDCRFPWR